MANYGMIKSFHIDNGELDGLRLKDAFVLGYELAQIDEQLKTGEPLSRPVHSANRERIEESCRDAKRQFRLTWMQADGSEDWMQLEVARGQSRDKLTRVV